MFIRQLSLQTKVSLLIIVPGLLILSISTVLSYSQQRQSALKNMSLLASQTGEVIEQALQQDMLESNFERIQAMFDAIGKDDRIRTLYLLDPSGRVAFAPAGQAMVEGLDPSDETCQPCHRLPPAERPSGIVVTMPDGQAVFRSMHPIENGEECQACHDPNQRLNGLLLTDLSIAPVEAALAKELRNNLIWWAGTVIAVALLANLAVNRWVLRRLRDLASAIEDFGKRGQSPRLPDSQADEIGRVSAAFNIMADRVVQREIENQALTEALRERADERGQLLEQLIMAQEEERKRVARELHDHLGQELSSTALNIEAARRAMERGEGSAPNILKQAHSLISDATDRMYALILGLRPSLLDDLGLVPALRAHAELSFESADISFEMDVRGMEERILAPIETALFRIFQEALTNVVRHANATRVVIRIERADHSINGSIQDDGIGFHPAEFGSGARDGRGFGLLGMQERAKILGGHIEISSKPGEGTLVKIQVPIPSTNVD